MANPGPSLSDRIHGLRTLQQESEERRQRAVVAEKEVIEAFLAEWHQLPATTRRVLFDTLSNQMKTPNPGIAITAPVEETT